MKKKIVSLLLTGCIMLSLAACAGNKGVDVKESKGTSTETAEEAAEGTAKEVSASRFAEATDWRKPYDETVKLSIVNEQHTTAQFPDGDDMSNNIWTRSFLKDLNIEVATEWVSTEYETKLNLAIASQSLPDVFRVNATQFQQLLDADLIMDITDVYESTASNSVKSFLEAERDIADTAKKDGRLYAIPTMFYGYIDKPQYLWMRKDWMNEMGAAAPKTVDEMEKIIMDMMAKYGGYGIAIDKTLEHIYQMAPIWGAYPKIWIEDKDEVIQYGTVMPEMKLALQKWADWYSKGIIKSDFATMDFNAMREDVINGKVGAQPFEQWWGYGFGSDIIRNNNPEAYFEPYVFPSATGEAIKYPVKFPNEKYTVINKNCKNPEAAIKLVNYYNYITMDGVLSEEMTLSDMLPYTKGDMAHVTGPFYIMNPIGEYAQYVEIQDALMTENKNYKFSTAVGTEKYAEVLDWMESGNPDNIGYVLQVGAENCAYSYGKEIVDKDEFIKTKVWGALPEELSNYGSTLDDLLVEGFTKIIMGAEPIDYFDTLVKNWKAAGGEEVTAAVNEMYK